MSQATHPSGHSTVSHPVVLSIGAVEGTTEAGYTTRASTSSRAVLGQATGLNKGNNSLEMYIMYYYNSDNLSSNPSD